MTDAVASAPIPSFAARTPAMHDTRINLATAARDPAAAAALPT